VTFGKELQSIDESAFENCVKLASADFQENLLTIGTDAFGGCTSLRKVTLPDKLKSLGENAFKARDYERSGQFFTRGLKEYGRVADSLGTYHKAQYLTWRAYYELIHLKAFDAALASASAAYGMQPDNTLVKMNYAYACLYSGNEETAEKLLKEIASSGLGEADTIKRDLQAQKDAGLVSKSIDI
jgi:hypothetical protein